MSHQLDKFEVPPQFARHTQYMNPWRAKIEVYDPSFSIKLFEYDSWENESDNPILMKSISTTLGANQTGMVTAKFLDLEEVFPPSTWIGQNIITVKMKKFYGEPWTPLLLAFQGKYRPKILNTYAEHNMLGFGLPIAFGHRIVNVKRLSSRADLLNNKTKDPNMIARVVIKDLLSNPLNYAVSDSSIAEDLQLDLSPLDESEVIDELYGIHEPFVELRQAINNILNLTGAEIVVDSERKVYFRYSRYKHSKLTLKRWEYASREENTDLAKTTSYFFDDWDIDYDWTKEAGMRNRLFTKAQTTNHIGGMESASPAGYMYLFDRDIAFPFQIPETKLRDVAFVVSKTGNGTSEPDRIKNLHGHIIADSNGTPSGQNLGYFDIPLSEIPQEQATPMYLQNLVVQNEIQPNTQAWFSFYDRGNDQDNTIQIYYTKNPDGVFLPFGLRFRNSSSYPANHNSNTGWQVAQAPFQFIHSIFDQYTHHVYAERTASQKRFGLKEDVIDTSFATDSRMSLSYLDALLDITAYPKMLIASNMVSIPEPFQIGKAITVYSKMAHLNSSNAKMSIDSVTYQFGENESGIGCAVAQLGLVGIYDFMYEKKTKSKNLCAF